MTMLETAPVPWWDWIRAHWVRVVVILVACLAALSVVVFFTFVQVGSTSTHVQQQQVAPLSR